MKFEHEKDFLTGAMRFTLTIYPDEYVRARLSQVDKAVIHDCQQDRRTIADRLVGLELIARRIEEAHDAAA